MIVNRSIRANPWAPDGFEAFVSHYPNTDWKPVRAERDRSGTFIERWLSNGTCMPKDVSTAVLTPGLFSEFLPRCFAPAAQALAAAGFRVVRTRVRSRHGVREQARRLANELRSRLDPGEPFVWCGHSKGAIDLLYALETEQDLRESCTGAVVVQPAVGISRVVDRWQNYPRDVREQMGRILIGSAPVRQGVREISNQRDPVVADWLSGFEPSVPTLCVVTWSIQPTSWVDSYHRTLREIAPGHAHDGQFLMVDQRLPGATLVCLPELDHAQPVFGGHSFDAGRFWRTLVGTALP